DAVGGGVTAHASCAGVGSPSMRQRNASPYWAVPAVVNPAAWSAVRASVGCPGAQPRSILPPEKWVKSTITVTPTVALHAGVAPAAPPTAGAPTAIPMLAIAAPMVAFMTGSSAALRSARREGHDRRRRRAGDRQRLAHHRRDGLDGRERVG